jgi:hypothetical protein
MELAYPPYEGDQPRVRSWGLTWKRGRTRSSVFERDSDDK